MAKDPAFQKCVIAYASEYASPSSLILFFDFRFYSSLMWFDDSFSFIGTAARACGLGATSTPRLGMLASLDHTLHFYDDTVDASDWLLFYVRPPPPPPFPRSAVIKRLSGGCRWKLLLFVREEDWSRGGFISGMERWLFLVYRRESSELPFKRGGLYCCLYWILVHHLRVDVASEERGEKEQERRAVDEKNDSLEQQ